MMRSLKGFKSALSILSAMGFILACCATVGATPEEHLEMLYKAAKAEGEVIFHYTGSASAMDPVVKAFREKYPDIKISVVSIGAATIPTRLIAEAGATRISVDVASCLMAYIMPVLERDLLTQYDWAKHMGVDPNRITFDNRLVDYYQSPRVWMRNTKLVSNADAPKSWEDVLNPKWKGGKIIVRAAPSGFTWLWPEWKKDKEKVIAFLKGFAAQDVIPGKRDAMVVQSLATGECPIGTISANNAVRDIGLGAPIAVISLGATASDAGVLYIPKGVPHPKAARFLMAWLVSEEGKKLLLEAECGFAYPPDASPVARMLADNNIPYIPIKTAEDIKEYTGPFTDAVMKIMDFIPQ